MTRDYSTVVQSPLDEILRRRGPVPHKKSPSHRVVDFFRSVEAKVSRRLPERTPVNSAKCFPDSQNNLGTAFINSIQLSERQSEIDIRTPDTANDSFRNPLRIPGCSPPTFVYPRGNANIPAIHETRFETLVGIFRKNTKEDPQLAEFHEYIDYSLRLCGTSPRDCVPSIVVFCRPAEFKNLRTLLTSPQLKYQYALRRHVPKYPWSETQMLATEQGHKPFFNLYFWREKRPRELYWGRAPVCLRQETIEAYRPPQNPPSSISSTAMLGSVVQLPGLDQRSSTLGCIIKIDSEYYAITTMHTFAPSQSPCGASSTTESDDKSTSNNSTAPTVFNGTEVPLQNSKEIFEPNVYELLAEDDYYVADVQYDSLSDDEGCEPDQADDWSLDTDDSTLHQSPDGHRSEESKEMLAIFPSKQQLQASGELDLDWALIKVTNLNHCCFNTFSPTGSHSESISIDKIARSQPHFETPVFIVTSGKVPQKGFLQPGISLLGGISGKTPSSVWTVILDDGSSLKKGDSGSVVVDAISYDIYGHVVGCNPMGEVYISPYRAILQQIRRLFPEAAISLPESSSTRLCHSAVTSTGQCRGDPDIAPRLPHGNNPSIQRLEIEYSSDAFKCHNEVQPNATEQSNVSEIPYESCSILHVDDSQSSMRFHGIKNRARGTSSESVPTTPNLSSHDTSILAAQFREYLQDNLVDGVNGEGKAAPYIPLSAVKTYFTKSHIDTIVRSLKVSPLDITADIHSSYLRILSILVFIGYPDSISWFTSNDLQDSDLPLGESCLQHNPSWFDAFLEEQWKFCPFIISPDGNFDRVLSSKTILPVTYEKSMAGRNTGPDTPRLWQVKVHPGCSHNLEGEQVVFKVYQGTRALDMYTTETNIYSKLPFGADNAITRTYTGFSFPESQRCIAVFEHANGGSLTEFFRSKSPPPSSENVLLFWEKMLKLTEALTIIHGIDVPNELPKHSSNRVHRDIRPENILVCSKDENDSISGIDFKFEGCTLVEPDGLPFPDEEIATKENRNRMYLPPESSSNLTAMHSTEANIWSLGAVYSDCLVWSISGEAGRQRYLDRRMIELIDHNPCYHDGVKRLPVVDEFHELALLHKKNDDLITPFMSRFILKMLAPAGERCTAMQITESFQAKIKQLRLSLPITSTIAQPVSPDSVTSDPSLARMSPEAYNTKPTSPTLLDLPGQSSVSVKQHSSSSSVADTESSEGEATIEMVYRMLKEKKTSSKLGNSHKTKLSKWDDILRLPWMRKAHENIKLRDHIFVIDNSISMEKYRRQVMKTARVLSYMCKEADKNGMDLFFTSKATKKPRKFKTSSQIEQAIKHAKVINRACDMGTYLDYVLKKVFDDGKAKPKSIYVFTNGVWDETDWDSGVEGVVSTICRKSDDLRASGLSIQFIQFGHDPEGTENLERVESANSDLVSVRHFTDSVPRLMSAGTHTPEIPIPKISSVEDEVQSIFNAELGGLSLGT